MATTRAQKKQQEQEKLADQRESLQDDFGLSEAEADLVLRRTDGGSGDVEAEALQVISERVGPSALAGRAPEPTQAPRMAPGVRLDDHDARIAVLEAELVRLRRARIVTESEALRVSRQGSLPNVDEPPTVVVAGDSGATQTAEGSGEPPDASLPADDDEEPQS